ncbi:hypothetical protein AB0I53_13660, partial [Saccharopolyspora sp. NPDC050389]|uniref:hypothetical protein n=1 Tax=Saccharopolyspora sp. NPDC050389 TaxID=3155516 RepID=UPI0033C0892C
NAWRIDPDTISTSTHSRNTTDAKAQGSGCVDQGSGRSVRCGAVDQRATFQVGADSFRRDAAEWDRTQ